MSRQSSAANLKPLQAVSSASLPPPLLQALIPPGAHGGPPTLTAEEPLDGLLFLYFMFVSHQVT